MKNTILTKNTVSKKQITKKLKGINTMKKLILATCLMVGATFASFAYEYKPAAITYNNPTQFEWTFTFDADGSYDLLLGDRLGLPPVEINALGYYFFDDPANRISIDFAGNKSDYFSTIGSSETYYNLIDINTAHLGEFKAGDTIGIWIQKSNGDIWTSSLPIRDFYGGELLPDGVFRFESENIFFQFNDVTPASSGAPLPGVWAALAIGGCAFLGRKIRNKIKK